MNEEHRPLVEAAKAALEADGRLRECTFDEGAFAFRVVFERGASTFFLGSLVHRHARTPLAEREPLIAGWAKDVLDRATDPAAIGEMNVVSQVSQGAITYKLPRAVPAGLLRLVGGVMMLPFILLVIVPHVFEVPSYVIVLSGEGGVVTRDNPYFTKTPFQYLDYWMRNASERP